MPRCHSPKRSSFRSSAPSCPSMGRPTGMMSSPNAHCHAPLRRSIGNRQSTAPSSRAAPQCAPTRPQGVIPPRMVTCELSRVCCWLARRQHNRQHMQFTRGKEKLVKSRKAAPGAFRKRSVGRSPPPFSMWKAKPNEGATARRARAGQSFFATSGNYSSRTYRHYAREHCHGSANEKAMKNICLGHTIKVRTQMSTVCPRVSSHRVCKQ